MNTTKNISDHPELLTVRDVAKKLRVCERSIWCYAAKGLIPAPIRLGARRLWLPGPLMDAVARLHAQAQQPDGREGAKCEIDAGANI